VRLLLDEMHAPEAAERLRSLGHDVLAVKERVDLIGLPDEELLAVAAGESRVLVTENVKDFAVLDRQWRAAGQWHAGLVFTHARRFPRSSPGHVPRLVSALEHFLVEHASQLRTSSFTWWLDVTGR
jgi:hypothetical protein